VYLKSLVLKGFKSFADRSVLSFEPGITAIVGPNGSGKSNISDSVLWVLGERNAKNLRGQAMEDVIFAGSSARKAVGVAEVDLVLDNSDGTLPIEYSEVALTRRMYRNGESEYLINGTPARRMDVLDILHDSGLGTGTHSIISQGHLSSILQSKPEDRRTLIEEAAGVLKHKQRKMKSERKLEQMDAHLARVQDIVAEVQRQVKPLERKAKRALAYKDLAGELAGLSLDLAVDDLRTLQDTWDGVGKREAELSDRIVRMREDIAQAEQTTEALQSRLATESIDAGAVAQRYRRAQAAFDHLDSNILLLHEKKRASQSYLAEMRLSLESDAHASHGLEAQRDEAREALEAAEAACAGAEESLQSTQARADDLQMQKRALQSAIDTASHRRREALQELEGVRAAQARIQEVLASNRAHEKLIGAHASELEQRIAESVAAKDESSAASQRMDDELAAARMSEDEVRKAVGDALTERDAARSGLDDARDVRASLSAEVKSLEEMERARTAENPLLAWILGHLDEFDAHVTPLIDEISAPDDLEPVVGELLGGDVAALFVRDADTAALVAGRLAAMDESGTVTLLPRDGMRNAGAAPDRARLIDSLEYTSGARNAVEALLGDVVLCGSVQEALDASRSLPGACCATREGAIVWPNGKITCARRCEGEAGILASHRSLEEAREALRDADKVLIDAQEQLAACEEALRAAQTEGLRLSQERARLQGAADSARSEAQRAAQAFEALSRESQSLDAQLETARQALAKAEPDAAELESRLQHLNDEIDGTKEKLDRKREELVPIRTSADQASSALNEARLTASSCRERQDYARRMLASREQDIRNAEQQQERARENIRRKSASLGRIDPLLETCEALASAAKERTRILEDLTVRSQDSSTGLHQQINDARTRARAAHDAFDRENEQLADIRVEKGRLEMQVESAIATIVQECGTPLERALSLPPLDDRSAVEDQAFKLRRRIANMGTINPDAAVEYGQLKARCDYLSSQLDDMLAARRSLMRIVHVIDARMKDDFVKTFQEVDMNFQHIFGMLFPGGSGSLSLVDPDDPENTGIEVNAQPNGKRILKMSLMSGGEQSLVAMALLFAVYKTRSTPFYILDEVEAALDDTNLRRLCAYLDSIREDTQFIMITHQRRTMEMSDVLYGISMQSDGVTKVMSQRLEKALRYAEG
jgi:chromosome segregation protein